MTKIYISGPITHDPNYKKKFARAEEQLKAKGFEVLNPAKIAEAFPNLTYGQYMDLDLTLLSFADAIYMLKGWEESEGASEELVRAELYNLKVVLECDKTYTFNDFIRESDNCFNAIVKEIRYGEFPKRFYMVKYFQIKIGKYTISMYHNEYIPTFEILEFLGIEKEGDIVSIEIADNRITGLGKRNSNKVIDINKLIDCLNKYKDYRQVIKEGIDE